MTHDAESRLAASHRDESSLLRVESPTYKVGCVKDVLEDKCKGADAGGSTLPHPPDPYGRYAAGVKVRRGGEHPIRPQAVLPAPPDTHPTPLRLPLESPCAGGRRSLERLTGASTKLFHFARREHTPGSLPRSKRSFENDVDSTCLHAGRNGQQARLDRLPLLRRHTRGSQRGVEGAWGRRGVPLGALWGAPRLPQHDTPPRSACFVLGVRGRSPCVCSPCISKGVFEALDPSTPITRESCSPSLKIYDC